MSEMWGSGKTLPPALTDPVVAAGTKYRIRSIQDGIARCRTSFRPSPGGDFDHLAVAIADLTWDRVAGVWRCRSEANS